jgi:hypothetical protein
MLVVYLDEAGTGKLSNEPILVVAGVIVPDQQWLEVNARIRALIKEHIPREQQSGFVFHATDLFHGSGGMRFLKHSPELRHSILEQLVSIPEALHLPIVHGWIDRQELADRYPTASEQEVKKAAQGMASIICTCAVERFTRVYGAATELAIMVYENNSECRKLVKELHANLQNPDSAASRIDKKHYAAWESFLPLERVIDTAHFAEKSEAPILQLADASTWVIRRRLCRKEDSVRFANRLQNQMVVNPKGGWPIVVK